MKQFIDYSFTSRHRHSKSKSIYKDDLKVDTQFPCKIYRVFQ